jgi:predicted CXXCH cytochrome family protein
MGPKSKTARVVRVAILIAAAAGILLPAFFASADTPAPCLRVIAPVNGATLAPGNALVIGTAKGIRGARLEIDVNGKAGKNIIRVSAGKTSVSIGVTGKARGAYRYHADVAKCAGCHERKGQGYAVGARKEALCYRCHDRQDGGKNLHGPLGSGECTECHDPHGSMNAALTVARTGVLCVSCHDQESSANHMKRSRGKACTLCHDPHSSDKHFLRK